MAKPSEPPLSTAEQASVASRLRWRIFPVVWLSALLNYMDRSNLSYAALQMNQDLQLTPRSYGLGAGLFFVSYTLLEVPSNFLLTRFGAVAWLARILISWGMVASCGVALQNEGGFLVLRLALGAAEAGFFPGISFYLSRWFRGEDFGIAYSVCIQGASTSGIIGGFLAIALMRLDGVFQLTGWQWLFLAEGLPCIALGCVYSKLLPEDPASAWFLTPRERSWLASQNAEHEASSPNSHGPGSLTSVWRAAANWRVYYLGCVHGIGLMAFYSLLFFTPLLVRQLVAPATSHGRAVPDARVVLLSAVPAVAASAAVVGNAWHSRRKREAKWHAAVPLSLAGVALVSLGPLAARNRPATAMVALTLATAGCWADLGPLATLWESCAPPGDVQASSFAIINAVGNTGGFIGPFLLGALQKGEDPTRGLILLGVLLLANAALVLAYRPPVATAVPDEQEALFLEMAEHPGGAGKIVIDRPKT